MTETQWKKEQIKACLNCRIGKYIIGNYGNIYRMDNCKDESDREKVEELAEVLELKGSVEERFKLLKNLCTNNSSKPEDVCLYSLQLIILKIKHIYRDNNYEGLIECQALTPYIWETMNKRNQETAVFCDSALTNNALKLLKKKNNDKSDDDIDEIIKGLRYIFTEFSSPKKLNHRESINSKGECFLQKVESITSVIETERKTLDMSKDFFSRINLLSIDYQKIILEYVRCAQKKFGYCLSYVMAQQVVTHNDIVNILTDEKLRPSSIQSWEISDNPQIPEKVRGKLCKALLISEDVLYSGTGKIYCNQATLHSDEFIQEIMKLRSYKKDTQAKTFVKKMLHNILKEEDFDIQNLTGLAPELFEENTIDVFADEHERFQNLLHKEEAYILLKVLEKMENEKHLANKQDAD